MLTPEQEYKIHCAHGMSYKYENKIIYLLAGSGEKRSLQRKRDLHCSQLLSQLNEKKEIKEWVEYLKAHPEYKGHLTVDSGAYTAYTRGKSIDIDAYIDFINEIGDYVLWFAQVDKIPQIIDREPTAEELAAAAPQSWENYLYMIKKIKPEYRDKLIPVFHYQEDEKWLKNMLEYTHEDGSHIPYIGLAASTVGSAKDRMKWLTECFKIIKASSNPNVMTHGFGTTSMRVIKSFPLTSVDSTTWIATATRGMIVYNEKSYVVSDRRLSDPANLYTADEQKKKEFNELFTKYNFMDDNYTVDNLSTDGYLRQRYNIRYIKMWEDAYEYKPLEAVKVTLW